MEIDRRRFETLLAGACIRWSARVHAYCWLPDSAQLLIEIFEVPLESVLRSLRGPYSHYIRERRGFRPPVYAGRYRALLIDPDEFLLDFARHIFWSPVKAGLSQNPLGYEYSSARTCVGEPAPPFLYTRTLMDALAARGFGSRPSFAQFLGARPTPGFASLLARGSRFDQRVAGGQMFVQEMHRLSHVPSRPVPLASILAWVGVRLRVSVEDILGPSRHHSIVEARALVAWLTTCIGSARLQEVAAQLSCGASSLHRAIRHYARLRPRLFSQETLKELQSAVDRTGED